MACRTIPENRLRKLFAKYIRKQADGCWLWLGPQTPGGYGLAQYKGHGTTAHRAVYQLMGGIIPEGLDLGHKCHVRLCVNPNHVTPMTRSENLFDKLPVSGCKHGHPFSAENFSIVHRSDGAVERRCKICHRERNRRWKHERSHSGVR
jgi:hypothetical protein